MGILDLFKKKKVESKESIKESVALNSIIGQEISKEKINISFNDFIKYLKDNNWKIEEAEDKNYVSKILSSRYKNIPKDWINFIKEYDVIANEDDTTWILCLKDYDNEEQEFKYNEFELMSLDGVSDQNKEDIIKYWNNNIPIIMSVKNGYEYYAIELSSGKIVKGFEPIFEEPVVVAESYNDFINKIVEGKINLKV